VRAKKVFNDQQIVDLTAVVMGPYCTQIMADMGADVVKIEPPEGDITRNVAVGPAPGMNGAWACPSSPVAAMLPRAPALATFAQTD